VAIDISAEAKSVMENPGNYGSAHQPGALKHPELLDRLNAEQASAVVQRWGPSLVIAGAGSGKTTVLTKRIAFLISELNQDPESILSVTFTNKAAAEMRHRIEAIVGPQVARRITIGTFHSICARLLRLEIASYKTADGLTWDKNFVIYDESDSQSLIKAQIVKLNLDDKVFVPKEIKHTISALKNDGYTHEVYAQEAKNYRENRLAEIFTAYQGELSRNNALDFDDLILMFTDLMQKNQQVRERTQRRFRHVLVDEFQDTNKSQYDLISLISRVDSPEHYLKRDNPSLPTSEEGLWNERSIMVVGDVDQSIYSWRKADFRIILGLQKDYEGCRMIKLEENYRSTSTILEAANSIIANNTERIDKVLRCNRGKGGKINCYEAQDEIDEAFYIAEELKRSRARGRKLSECVILYRTNSQSRAIEEVLVRSHIPYVVVGGTRFYDRQEIKDMIAYLKLVYNTKDGQAFNRVVNVPKRGLGKTTLERVEAYAELKNMSSIEACLEAERISELSAKTVQTLKTFASQVVTWQKMSETVAVSELLEKILIDTGYMDKLEDEANNAKDETALSRMENIREFVLVAKEFESMADEPDLDSFLTRISLVSDLDSVKDSEDTVKLMTIHSSKGLEFPTAFIMGLEEGLFPHVRSLDNPSQMEEERRLMYVAVTRAGDTLYITLARKRSMIGRGFSGGFSSSFTIPSRFLKEIQPGLISGYYPTGEDGFAKHVERQAGTWGQSQGQSKSYETGGGYERERIPDEESSFNRDGAQDRKRNREYSGFESKYGNDYQRKNSSGSGSNSSYGSGYGSGSGYGQSRSGSGSGYGSGSRSGSNYGSSSGYGSGSGYGSSSRPGNKPGSNAGSRPASSGSPYQSQSQPKPRVMRKEAESEATPPPTYEKLTVGDRVNHVKFGIGTMIEVIGDEDKELYVVKFAEWGEKRLDPRYAKLVKIS
jgi:DNA helicase-2/ATP-dependent DNA helicase PcrA